jgi:hypothetical protein
MDILYVIHLYFCLQLKRQAAESEATRRGLERARQEVVRQVTAIATEKENLEKEVIILICFLLSFFISVISICKSRSHGYAT